MSEIRITPDFENKCAEITGTASAGEKVQVILKNCSTKNTATLRLRVMFMGKTLAMLPIEATETSQFEAAGDDLVGEINLCTDQMLKVFKRAIPELHVLFVLDDPASDVRQMYFRECHTILGWPHEATDTPIDLANYKDRMDEFDAAVREAQKNIDDAIDDFTETLGGKVDKVAGKGLSTIDMTPELLGEYAQKTDLSAHAMNTELHVSAQDRENWNAKAGKLDLVTQGGYLYVPDMQAGGWRRMQAMYNEEMQSVCTVLSDEMYIRKEDGSFELEAT